MKKTIIGILSFLIVLFLSLGLLGMLESKTNNKDVVPDSDTKEETVTPTEDDKTTPSETVPSKDTPTDQTPTEDITPEETAPDPKQIDKDNVVGSYGKSEKDDKVDVLHLRKDGTFYLYIVEDNAVSRVGTYIIKNNEIVLTEKVHYGNDNCFYKNDLKLFSAKIYDNYIQLLYKSKNIQLEKLVAFEEIEDDIKYYSVNPKDGVKPDGWDIAWKDCTK